MPILYRDTDLLIRVQPKSGHATPLCGISSRVLSPNKGNGHIGHLKTKKSITGCTLYEDCFTCPFEDCKAKYGEL